MLDLRLIHVIVMGKVVAAVGMILLALEDELALNKAAQERERRARRELEAYTNLILARRRVEDFDRQGSDICKIVVAHSRFAQAALLLESGGPVPAGRVWRALMKPRLGAGRAGGADSSGRVSCARVGAARRGAKPDARRWI